MAIYPIPFSVIPSDYSFGKIHLDIQIDHPSKSYQFVYRAQDRIGHVIKDTNDTEMMWVYFTDTGLFNVQELENVPEVYKRDDIRMTFFKKRIPEK